MSGVCRKAGASLGGMGARRGADRFGEGRRKLETLAEFWGSGYRSGLWTTCPRVGAAYSSSSASCRSMCRPTALLLRINSRRPMKQASALPNFDC